MSEHPSIAESVLRNSVLASPATLAKLAAAGMFASVPLSMPPDIRNVELTILFDGELTTRSILEVYAPGDESGWAVVYKPGVDGKHIGETELIFGNWQLVRGAHDHSRKPKADEHGVPYEPKYEDQETQEIPESDVGSLADMLGDEDSAEGEATA